MASTVALAVYVGAVSFFGEVTQLSVNVGRVDSVVAFNFSVAKNITVLFALRNG